LAIVDNIDWESVIGNGHWLLVVVFIDHIDWILAIGNGCCQVLDTCNML